MIQPLNYLPKAIADFEESRRTAPPLSKIGLGYLAEKMRQAQAFLLPDHGELLDRDKARPEMPGLIFKPPYPVTALEYQSGPGRAITPGMPIPCSRRIVLAWDWSDDYPEDLRDFIPPDLGAGVAVASIIYLDTMRQWAPVGAAAFFPYEGEWVSRDRMPSGPLHQAMLATNRIKPSVAESRCYPFRPFGLLPEVLAEIWGKYGEAASIDMMCADLMDELNAFTDFSLAMACRNVSVETHPAPSKLNKIRSRSGKVPLFDYHVLKLADRQGGRGGRVGEGLGTSPRPHLRRGHIRHLRHLGPDRITWVNAAMVRGRGKGFARKDYAVERSA